MMTRRTFTATAALAAASACISRPAPTPRVLGLQTYMLGPDIAADLPGAFARVAAIGYGEIELPGLYNQSPQQLRAMIDAAGLRCPSVHVPLHPFPGVTINFENGVSAVADTAHALGAEYVVVPMVPWPTTPQFASREEVIPALVRSTQAMTVDDWRRAGETFNRLGAGLAREQLKLAYHNHNLEFLRVGDSSGIELLIAHTDPGLVHLEVDIGWVAAAGMNPASFIARHAARVKLLHLKDMKATPANTALTFTASDVGQGVVDFAAVLAAARQAGVEHYFVEQEPPFVRPPMESAATAFDFLRPQL
ncbi:MAG: sugar phosphate isomerase/epimerase [Terricaulis sp.]